MKERNLFFGINNIKRKITLVGNVGKKGKSGIDIEKLKHQLEKKKDIGDTENPFKNVKFQKIEEEKIDEVTLEIIKRLEKFAEKHEKERPKKSMVIYPYIKNLQDLISNDNEPKGTGTELENGKKKEYMINFKELYKDMKRIDPNFKIPDTPPQKKKVQNNSSDPNNNIFVKALEMFNKSKASRFSSDLRKEKLKEDIFPIKEEENPEIKEKKNLFEIKKSIPILKGEKKEEDNKIKINSKNVVKKEEEVKKEESKDINEGKEKEDKKEDDFTEEDNK